MDAESSRRPTDDVAAADAIAYALDRTFLGLFGLLVAGWVVNAAGPWLVATRSGRLARGPALLVGYGSTLVGAFLVFTAVIAIAYTLLQETR